MSKNLLQLIAPEIAGEPEDKVASRMRSAITLARLLSATASRPRVDSTGFDLVRAGRELDKCVRADTLQVLQQMFFLHLEDRSGLGPWQRPKAQVTQLWKGIVSLEERKISLALPSLPEPGESREDVALRILAAALCLGLSECASNNWRGHLAFTKQDPLQAESYYRKALEGEGVTFDERATAIAGVGGCLLDRGVVFLARDWMDRHLDLAAACPKLARLAGLTSLAAGDRSMAEQLLRPEPSQQLPSVFNSLGDRVPSVRSVLGGSFVWKPSEPAVAATPRRISRSDYGASVLVIMCAPGTTAECLPLRWDLAASVGQPTDAWLDRQVAAPWTAGEPEQAIVAGAKMHVELVEEGKVGVLSRSCLSTTAKAVALVPVTQPESEALLGWVRLEFEHWLVPDPSRLEALGRAARCAFAGVSCDRAKPRERTAPYGHLFSELMEGVPLGRRRWWGFVDGPCGPEQAATGGEALRDWEGNPGGRGSLNKASRMGKLLQGPMAYEGGIQSMHGDSKGGLLTPVLGAGGPGHPQGWLLVESTRATDLDRGLADDLAKRCRLAGPRFGLAQFNEWHQERYGHRVHLATTAHGELPEGLGQALLESNKAPKTTSPVFQQLARLGGRACGEPVLIVASAGAGKTVAGRFILFCRGLERVVEISLRGLGSADLGTAIRAARDGGVILKDGEHLDPDVHGALDQLLRQPDAGRFVVTARQPILGQAPWEGLADRLMRNRIKLPDMGQRRASILPCFRLLLAKAARLERRIAPELTSEAEGLLWRGDWKGGLRSLSDFAHQIVIFHDGDTLDGVGLARLALEREISLPHRLSSKHLDPISLWSAIESTRKKCGAIHRGRAAALMGWDPDTLTAKLKALGMGAG